ncbi:MAG: formylmethanofuran dehydrogenase [Chloroflexi bacterium]|nr:formylmethanofuran dehydrogenase [Chloroflexota bacterium]
MEKMQLLLKKSAKMHKHLCPRQVLGVRMGILAGELFNLDLPQTRKRLLTIVETDGCFTDGISVATNCWVGRRTLRVEDLGKVAATFVDTKTNSALRIAPNLEARSLARDYAPEAKNRWESQLLGYQRMSIEDLFVWKNVQLTTSLETLISYPGKRANCAMCGEEIINQREVIQDKLVLCKTCTGVSYYVEELEAVDLNLTISTLAQSKHAA